jgi:hypothetical protein
LYIIFVADYKILRHPLHSTIGISVLPPRRALLKLRLVPYWAKKEVTLSSLQTVPSHISKCLCENSVPFRCRDCAYNPECQFHIREKEAKMRRGTQKTTLVGRSFHNVSSPSTANTVMLSRYLYWCITSSRWHTASIRYLDPL